MGTRKKSAKTGTRGVERPLSVRERLFAHIVARPGVSQTQAAREAGYLGEDATLATQASRLMRRPKVEALVEKLREKQLEKLDAKAVEVLDELRHVALARLSRTLREDMTLKPLGEWTEHELAALSKVEVEEQFDIVGALAKDAAAAPEKGAPRVVQAEPIGRIAKLEMKGKLDALGLLAKHHHLVDEKVEHEHSGEVRLVQDPYATPTPEAE